MRQTLDIYVRRGKSFLFGAFLLVVTAGMGWFTWILADSGFSAGGSRRAAILEDWPVEIRAGAFGLVTLACLYAAFMALRNASRTGPAFSLSDEGATDLRGSGRKFMRWDEIEGMTLDANFIVFRRRERGGISFNLGGLGPDRIAIPLQHVTIPLDALLAAIAERAPHLAGLNS